MRGWQLGLDLGPMPASRPHLWDRLPLEHQRAVVAVLARLIARAAVPNKEDLRCLTRPPAPRMGSASRSPARPTPRS